jgi:hypothetical protein
MHAGLDVASVGAVSHGIYVKIRIALVSGRFRVLFSEIIHHCQEKNATNDSTHHRRDRSVGNF